MTKEDAITICKQHAMDVHALAAVLALAGLSFATVGEEVEKGLGLPKDSLAAAIIVPQGRILSAISEYAAVLENAAKGKLAPAVEE